MDCKNKSKNDRKRVISDNWVTVCELGCHQKIEKEGISSGKFHKQIEKRGGDIRA